jgi:hypothetical protein
MTNIVQSARKRQSDTVRQDGSPMGELSTASDPGTVNVTLAEFTGAIFGDDIPDGEQVLLSKQIKLGGAFINMGVTRASRLLISRRGAAIYFNVSSVAVPEEDEKLRRRKIDCRAAYCFVADDVGTKVDQVMVEPSWILESSEGSFQYGYILDPEEDLSRYEAFVTEMGVRGYTDAGAEGCNRLMRVPGSINLKKDRDRWASRITRWEPKLFWSLDELAEAFGIDLNNLPEKKFDGGISSKPVAQAKGGSDPLHVWLEENGHVVSDDGVGDFIGVTCPWAREHTTGEATAGYSPLGRGEGMWRFRRGFRCFHEHCRGRHYEDLADWAESKGGPHPPGRDWLAEMNATYFVVNEDGKAVVYRPKSDLATGREVLERFTFNDLRNLYLNDRLKVGENKNGTPKMQSVATVWLQHRKRREFKGGVAFAPGQTLPPDVLNLWRGFGVKARDGDWSKMRDHILQVICSGDEKLFAYVMGWLANAIQAPGKQGEVALILRGGRGTGKGSLGNFFGRLFGQHFLYVTNAEHLVGRFNAHLRDVVLLFSDEAFFAGDKKHESVLKGLITDPFITIEVKGGAVSTTRNVVHLLMASNDKWVVPAGADERRFCVVDVSNTHKQDGPYFKALHEQMEGGGLEAMLFDFLKYDLSEFDVRDVPQTAALMEQKMLSLRGPAAWLYYRIEKGRFPGGTSVNGGKIPGGWGEDGLIVNKNTAYEDYRRSAKDFRDFHPVDIGTWAKEVREILGDAIRDYRPETGERRRAWIIGSPKACKKAFEQHLRG